MNSLFPQKTLVCSSFECLDINIRAPFGSDILHCVPGKNTIKIILLTLSSSLSTGGREDGDNEAVEDQHQERQHSESRLKQFS